MEKKLQQTHKLHVVLLSAIRGRGLLGEEAPLLYLTGGPRTATVRPRLIWLTSLQAL